MRDRAEIVIVGAGIVGTSAAHHLAELGLTDVQVLDQGPLFETGGSTSHAPGLVFQTNGSRTMCRLAQDSVALYEGLELDGEPCWYGVGGIEVATTPERSAELRRRQGFARSFGIEGTELLSAGQAAERIPLLNEERILGAYFVPSDGVAKAVRISTALARRRRVQGRLVRRGRARDGIRHRRRTRAGGANRPRTDRMRPRAAVRRHLGTHGGSDGRRADPARRRCSTSSSGPIPSPSWRARRARSRIPILRHQDMAMYFRHREDFYGVGSYRHEPVITPQPRLSGHGRGMQPSIMPFTPDDFVAAQRRGRPAAPGARGAPSSGGSGSLDQRHVLVHAGRGLDRRRVGGRARHVGVRGRLDHARRGHGAHGRRVDGRRRAQHGPRRGRREPVLPVHDHASVRSRAWRATVPGGLRHPAPAPADVVAPGPSPDAVPPAGGVARRGVLLQRGMGAPAVVRAERVACCRAPRGSDATPGPRRTGRPPWASSTSRRASGWPCSTSRRS